MYARWLTAAFAVSFATTPALSQDVIGYIIQTRSPIRTVACYDTKSMYEILTSTLRCQNPGEFDSGAYGVSCIGNNLALGRASNGQQIGTYNAWTCGAAGCGTLTIFEEWPEGGSTYRMVDCSFNLVGLGPGDPNTLYLTSPTNLPEGFTESNAPTTTSVASRTIITTTNSVGITTTSDSENDSTTVDSETSSTTADSEIITESAATLTTNTASDPTRPTSETTTGTEASSGNSDSDNGNGNKAGLTAGAVVGSLAGVALIIATLLMGIRLGRRNARDNPNSSGFRESFRSIPRPKVTVSWAQPPPNQDMTNQPAVAELGGIARGNNAVELENSRRTQGWANTDYPSLPYEMDTNLPPQELSAKGNH